MPTKPAVAGRLSNPFSFLPSGVAYAGAQVCNLAVGTKLVLVSQHPKKSRGELFNGRGAPSGALVVTTPRPPIMPRSSNRVN
jgi:hypothetical protein